MLKLFFSSFFRFPFFFWAILFLPCEVMHVYVLYCTCMGVRFVTLFPTFEEGSQTGKPLVLPDRVENLEKETNQTMGTR